MDLRVNVSQSRLVTGFHLPSPCQLAMAVFGKKSAGCGKYHNLTLGMNLVLLFSNNGIQHIKLQTKIFNPISETFKFNMHI